MPSDVGRLYDEIREHGRLLLVRDYIFILNLYEVDPTIWQFSG